MASRRQNSLRVSNATQDPPPHAPPMPDQLIQIVDAAVADAYRRGGPHLVCRPGCSQCCIGVFPIAHEDAARLREGLAALAQTDPARAAPHPQARVADIPHPPRPLVPRRPSPPASSPKTTKPPSSSKSSPTTSPAPSSTSTTGTCDLYEHRPILCRTFGPPMRTAGRTTSPPASSATSTPPPKRSPPASSTPPSPPRKKPATKPSTPPTTSTAKP